MADLQADIHAHHLTKLRRVCIDIAQSCEIAELTNHQTVEIIMSGLMLEFVRGAAALGMNETDFIKLCRVAYRAVYPHARGGRK
jgi:hypothetical protein